MKTTGTSTVQRGRGYQGTDAYRVVNPNADKMPPGRTVLICPEHEEAPGWRAILAGVTPEGDAVVVPLQGHFGELRLRRLTGTRDLCLSRDEPFAGGSYNTGDECDWTAAKALALSTAMALGLHGLTF